LCSDSPDVKLKDPKVAVGVVARVK
jgi:hypothetical protein